MNKKIILTIAAIIALGISSLSFSSEIAYAIKNGDLLEIKRLITNDNINENLATNYYSDIPYAGHTPLSYACHLGKFEIVEELLKNINIDINKKEGLGEYSMKGVRKLTPLHYAVRIAHPDIVKLLLKNGALFDAEKMYYYPKEGTQEKKNKTLEYINLAYDYDNSTDKAKFLDDIKNGKNKKYANLEDAYNLLILRSRFIVEPQKKIDSINILENTRGVKKFSDARVKI